MKKKMICCSLIVILCMLLLSACAKKEPQTATLVVPSNPTTGYEWTVSQDPELFDVSSEYTEPAQEGEEPLVGAAGTQTFVLTPKAAGTTTVNFLYERTFEDTEPEARITYTIKIDKNMQLKQEAATAALPGDISGFDISPEFTIK